MKRAMPSAIHHALLLSALTAVLSFATPATPVLAQADRVIAKVDGVEIRESDLAFAEEDLAGNIPNELSGDARRDFILSYLTDIIIVAKSPETRKAVDWLISIQNADGGWGEDGTSYKLAYRGHEPAPSTASQTAWALLGLMAAGEIDHPCVERGISYLLRTQARDGLWEEQRFTATGFPRVFYLRYHGYPKFFPLWALARYRNLRESNARAVAFGM